MGHQGWLEEGFRGEEHTSRSNLWLDGRQPSQEVREHGMVEGYGCLRWQGDHPRRYIVRMLQQLLPRAGASIERANAYVNLWYLQDQGCWRCPRRTCGTGHCQAWRGGGFLANTHSLQPLHRQGLHSRDASPACGLRWSR